MRAHRSLKLLNTASTTSGKLTVYTELDHQFIIGDLVYISGGYYDNIDASIYSGSWSNVNNPFVVRPYKVLSINYSLNLVVLDIDVSGSPKFPYCAKTVTSNTTASPLDNSDKAYATAMPTNNPNLFRGVYISQVAMPKPRLVKGIVNNGIIGADKVQAYLGKKVSNGGTITNRQDVTLMHCVGKNIKSELIVINSKSFGSGLPTSKFRVNDTFNLVGVAAGNDNDGYGYSQFERADLQSSIANGIRLQRTQIGNQGRGAININNAKIEAVSLGSDGLIEGLANQVSNSVIDNTSSLVRGVTFSTVSPNTITAGVVRSCVDIAYPNAPATYNSAANTITLSGLDNSIVLNTTFYAAGTPTGFVTGFTDSRTGFPLHALNGAIKVISATCTYGSANTGVLVLEIAGLSNAGRETAFMAEYVSSGTVINMTMSTLRLWYNHGGELTSTTQVIPSGTVSLNTTSNNGQIDASSGFIVIEGGHYTGGLLSDNVSMNAASQDLSIYLNNIRQLTTEDASPVLPNYSCVVLDTPWTFEANLERCSVLAGKITGGRIVECDIRYDSRYANPLTFLYHVQVMGKTTVSTDVLWESVSYFKDAMPEYIIDADTGIATFNPNGHFQNRAVRFMTAPNIELPLTPMDYAYNLNTTKTYDAGNYVSGVGAYPIVVKPAGVDDFKLYTVPFTTQNPSTDIKDPGSFFYSMYDLGDLQGPYNALHNRNRLLYVESNASLSTVINNIRTNNLSGVKFTDLTIDDPNHYEVDNNFVYELSNWYKRRFSPPKRINAIASVHTPIDHPGGGYPNFANFTFTTSNPTPGTSLTIYTGPGTENSVSTGTHQISFRVLAWIVNGVNPATVVPQSFVEIESIRFERLNPTAYAASVIMPEYGEYNEINQTMSNQYAQDVDKAWSNPMGGGTHPLDYTIPYTTPTLTSGNAYRIIVSVHVQLWHGGSRLKNCGIKERREYTLILEA